MSNSQNVDSDDVRTEVDFFFSIKEEIYSAEHIKDVNPDPVRSKTMLLHCLPDDV